jgi:hypothetical protein
MSEVSHECGVSETVVMLRYHHEHHGCGVQTPLV